MTSISVFASSTTLARTGRASNVPSPTLRSLSLDSPSPPQDDLLENIPSTRRPSRAEVLTIATIDQLHTTDDNTAILVHRPHTDPMCHARDLRPPPLDPPQRVYVRMLMRQWVLRTCYPTTSCHFGVSRTLSMLRRFYWWIGRDISTRWWLHHCRKHQVRKASRLTIRWSTFSLPFTNGPGILVSVDYSGPLPLTLRGNACIFLFTDRFSRRADIYTTTLQFATSGTAHILVDQCIPLWGCPVTLLSDKRITVLRQSFPRLLRLSRHQNVATSSYHPCTNGGVEHVNHTIALMLAMVSDEKQRTGILNSNTPRTRTTTPSAQPPDFSVVHGNENKTYNTTGYSSSAIGQALFLKTTSPHLKPTDAHRGCSPRISRGPGAKYFLLPGTASPHAPSGFNASALRPSPQRHTSGSKPATVPGGWAK